MTRIKFYILSSAFCLVFAPPFNASALESPKQIGYYCSPQTSSIVEGQYYILQSDPCTYLSASLSFGPRVGNLYRGTIGSSTAIGGHGLGFSSVSDQFGDAAKDEAFNIQQGEDMFIAIFRDFNGSQSTQFNNYFRTGAGTIPHDDYGFIRFKYGVAPPPEPDEPDPVIIIPGILGSEQHNGEWIIDPILHTYDDLIATLDANGYTPDVDLFPFPYNWRKSNVETALLLKEKIDAVKGICQCDKVDLVAHSMGGLAARQYIQSDAYDHDVDQLIFLGTPHLGAPKAYLMWEGGELSPVNDFFDELTERLLEHEAHEMGYLTLFEYLRTEPIDSVRELLPVYDYIFDNNDLRSYFDNYPRNIFLEDLNSSVDELINSGIEIHNIIGETGVSETISAIQSTDAPHFLPMWQHGYPDGFYNTFGSHGLILGSGDKTVPIASASFVNINVVATSSVHSALPLVSQGEVFRILTGENAPTIISDRGGLNARLLLIKILSPADLLVIAPNEEKIGKQNGQEVNTIPNAFYTGFNTDTEFITILNPLDGEYKVFTEGTGSGAYTVETAFISSQETVDASFTGNTVPGLITELNLSIDNQNPEEIGIMPEDTAPPIITILKPEAKDYIRSQPIPIDVSAQDSSGVFALETTLGTTTIPNVGTIDPFFKKLGIYTITASSTDNVGNSVTSTRNLRIIATPASTMSDIERAYSLGWMIQSVRDKLRDKLQTYITKLQQTKKADKFILKDILNELDRQRGKGLNEQGYQLIKEDVQWLINN